MDEIYTETIPEQKKRSLFLKILWILFFFMLVFALGYFAVSMISADKTLQAYNRTYGTSDGESSSVSFVPYSIAFLEARHTMSKVDSVSLSINLTDSIAALEMGGVVVFRAPLEGSRVSPLLKAMKPEALSNLLRSPARIVSYYATIEKEPIIIKQAPRDTTEAAKDDNALPVVVRQAAFFTIHLDSGIRIVVMPHEEGGLDRFVFIARQNLYLFRQRLAILLKGDLPEYVPVVVVEVSADDAKTLFRALPEGGQVALKL